jgi:hypothetical protein
MHWYIARYARCDCIHKLLVLAEINVDAVADSELIEMISVPIQNLEDCGAELFEGGLVGDLDIAMPTWEEIARSNALPLELALCPAYWRRSETHCFVRVISPPITEPSSARRYPAVFTQRLRTVFPPRQVRPYRAHRRPAVSRVA